MSVHYNPRTRYQTPPGAERWEAEHIIGRRQAAMRFAADYREVERRAAELALRNPLDWKRPGLTQDIRAVLNAIRHPQGQPQGGKE